MLNLNTMQKISMLAIYIQFPKLMKSTYLNTQYFYMVFRQVLFLCGDFNVTLDATLYRTGDCEPHAAAQEVLQ